MVYHCSVPSLERTGLTVHEGDPVIHPPVSQLWGIVVTLKGEGERESKGWGERGIGRGRERKGLGGEEGTGDSEGWGIGRNEGIRWRGQYRR